MNTLTLLNPGKVVFGNGCSEQFADDFISLGYRRALIVTAPPIKPLFETLVDKLSSANVQVTIYDSIAAEPSIKDLNDTIELAAQIEADSVIGIGGGSALDVAKLVAALYGGDQSVEEVFGIGKLKSRKIFMACLPTTSGTGSEVSPNAILLDESDNLKKGVVSKYLVPDMSYIDPLLTKTVPPGITAATGMDALTHCLEAYTNKYAHPVIDLYALEGIKLIAQNIIEAYKNGNNEEAREKVALGSVYGGMCLGPVNTAAVHALSYPLGGEFHIAHGLSNALLLPYVMKFNYPSAIKKYSEVAKALGSKLQEDNEKTAEDGIKIIFEMLKELNIPSKLSEIDIPEDAIDRIADGAMKVTRLLKNNPREITFNDAKNIYLEAY